MRFQKTTEYAIRVMVYLASFDNKQQSAMSIHERLNIPYKYLSRLLKNLADSNLLIVFKGKQGGYKLAKNPADIFLHEIVDVVEGLVNYERCLLGFNECSDDKPCSLHEFWGSHRESIKKMLFETNLKDLEMENLTKL
jgi:Rrf2 family protein